MSIESTEVSHFLNRQRNDILTIEEGRIHRMLGSWKGLDASFSKGMPLFVCFNEKDVRKRWMV